MSSTFPDRVDKAANSLRSIANGILKKEIQGATLKLPHTPETKDVVEFWFNNKEQLKALEQLVKNPPQILTSWPILYPNKQRAGISSGFGLSVYVVLIALEDLARENGLTSWEGGKQSLAKGDWTHFAGDKDHHFDKQGGGLAIVIQFEKATGQ